MCWRWNRVTNRCSAEPHVLRLEPLHPTALELLARKHGVAMTSAPMESARGVAASATGRITQSSPGARRSSPRLAIGISCSVPRKGECRGAWAWKPWKPGFDAGSA